VCRASVPLTVATLLDLEKAGNRGAENLQVVDDRARGEIEIQWSRGGGVRQVHIDPARDGAVHGTW